MTNNEKSPPLQPRVLLYPATRLLNPTHSSDVCELTPRADLATAACFVPMRIAKGGGEATKEDGRERKIVGGGKVVVGAWETLLESAR